AASVPALLLVVLIGCGRQNAPEVAEAPPANAQTETPNPPPTPTPPPEEEVTRIQREIKDLESAQKAVEGLKRRQENLRARTDNLPPAADSIIMGGSGKGEVAGKNDPAGSKPQSGYNAQNAEMYGVYVENDFRSPLVAPLSTFS